MFGLRAFLGALLGGAVALAVPAAAWASVMLNGGADVARVRIPQQSFWRADGTWLAPVVGAGLPAPPLPPAVRALHTSVWVEGFSVRGVTLVSASMFQPLLAPLVNRRVTAGELQALTGKMTALYAAKGYPAARVRLADQKLKVDGSVVQVEAVEAPAVRVVAVGPAKDTAAVRRAVATLQSQTVLRTADIEDAVAPLLEIPGLGAQAQLALTDATPTLVVATRTPRWDADVALSNHGSRFLGPNQFEAGVGVNGVIGDWEDRLRVDAVQSTNTTDLTYGAATYAVAMGPWETLLEAGGSAGKTHPGWTLEPLNLHGQSRAWHVAVDQPLSVGAGHVWRARLGFDHERATNSVAAGKLSEDVGSTARLGTDLSLSDPWYKTQMHVEVDKGLAALGATPAGTLTASRTRGTGTDFTKVVAEVEHLQKLNENWRLLLGTRGQFSDHALLAGEEIGFGGAGWGRGYSNQEILGDQGVLGKAELQLVFHPGFPFLPAYQLFGFYDFGAVWNKDRDPTESNAALTRLSGGFGARLTFSPTLTGELVVAKPLTYKPVAVGDGNVSVLFRIAKHFEGGEKL